MNTEGVGLEHLLAAAIVAAGGVLTCSAADVSSPEYDGKVIGIELTDDGIITMRLVDYDG